MVSDLLKACCTKALFLNLSGPESSHCGIRLLHSQLTLFLGATSGCGLGCGP